MTISSGSLTNSVIVTLDELDSRRRLNLLLPAGVRKAKSLKRNDPVLTDAQAATFIVWIGGRFSFRWRELHRVFFERRFPQALIR